jgi:hypothetical protein
MTTTERLTARPYTVADPADMLVDQFEEMIGQSAKHPLVRGELTADERHFDRGEL